MTNEQREAIEICKEKIIESFYDFPNPTSIELKDTDVEAIDTVLSILKEKDELYHKALTDLVKADRENIQLKKQIDLMAEYISKIDIEEDICIKNKTNPDWCNEDYTNCKNCIKQFFERKVEDVKDKR